MLNVTLCLNGVDHPWRKGRARRLTAVCCGHNPGFANLCCGEAVRGEIRSWAAVTILQHVAKNLKYSNCIHRGTGLQLCRQLHHLSIKNTDCSNMQLLFVQLQMSE